MTRRPGAPSRRRGTTAIEPDDAAPLQVDPSVPPPPAKARALFGVIEEASRLHFRLGALAARIHGRGVTSAGQRAVLRNLVELGPKTVPELAAMRPVARQYIQLLVNELVAAGHAELTDNPRHRKSKLVRATRQGRAALAAMYARERPAATWLLAGFDEDELAAAHAVLTRLRERTDQFEPE